ncbi:MAG: Hpt domain-containing protein, partial [Gammaproteobacteria bacterium]
LCRQLRPGFQLALLGWIRGDNTPGNLAKIGEIAERLELAATRREVHQLWWVIGGVVEALLEGGLDTSVSLKRLMGQADREMKRLPTIGEDDYAAKPPTELVNNLLYYIARSSTAGKRVGAIRGAFNLSDLVPGDDQVEEARENMAAPSPRLMTTVAAAIRDDLARVKDVLDIYVRTGMEHVEELTPQIELLKKIGDTLGVLGLGDLRETIQQKRGELQDIIDSGQPVEEGVLLDMAEALLYVEDHLDEKLFGLIRPTEVGEGEEHEPPADTEFDQVAQAVMRECVINLARVKDAVALVLERPHEAALLDGVPGYLRGITAGLMILEKENAVSVVDDIGEFIGELIEQGYTGVGSAELDLLADAVVSLEYYLETLQNGRKEPVYMLDNARACLQALRDAGPSVVPQMPADKDSSGMSTTMQVPDFESTQLAAATQIIPGAAVMSADGEERVDPELIELFIEEAGEEIESITATFPLWEQSESREDLLNQIRRSFHTLKGSGRMVGAELIGNFCWRFEDLLNRLINGTLTRDAAVVDCARRAVEALPELLEKLEVGTDPTADIDGLMREAESLAEGTAADDAADDEFYTESAETTVVPPDELVELGLESPAPVEDETASVEIDPALMEILSKETGGHLEVILNFVEEAADGIPPFPVTEELHRACHTLHGSVTMAQAKPAADVTGPLNQMIRRAFDHNVPLDGGAVSACADAVEAIAEIISGIDRGDVELPDTGDLQSNLLVIDTQIEEAAALAEAQSEDSIPPGVLIDDEMLELVDTGAAANEEWIESELEDVPADQEASEPEPEPIAEDESSAAPAEEAVQPDFDPEIAAIFSEEAVEILESIDAEISHATDKQLGENSLAELQRHLHTLKGGARLAGLMAMGELSHDLETLLVRIAGGSLEQTETRFDVLRAAVDELHRMSDEVGEGRAALPPQALIERISASLDDRPWEPAAEEVPAEAVSGEGFIAEEPAEAETETEVEEVAAEAPEAEAPVEETSEEVAGEAIEDITDESAEDA